MARTASKVNALARAGKTFTGPGEVKVFAVVTAISLGVIACAALVKAFGVGGQER